MKTITLSEAFAKATKGPLIEHANPTVTSDGDGEPIPMIEIAGDNHATTVGYIVEPANAALLAHCFNCFEELYDSLFNLVDDWERVHGPIPADHEAKAILAKANQVTLP